MTEESQWILVYWLGLPSAGYATGSIAFSTEEEARAAFEKAGLTHTPQTTAGQYARTVGEFAPAAIGGEESLLGRIGRYVLAPAVASETAGQLTKGTALEPVARAVGGLTGSGLTGAARNLVAERAATKALPTTEELEASAKGAYKRAKDAGVVVTSTSFDKMVTAMKSEMSTEGYHPARHPKAASELKILEAMSSDIEENIEERVIDAHWRLYAAKRALWRHEIRYYSGGDVCPPHDDERARLERAAKRCERHLDDLELQLGHRKAAFAGV